VRETAFDRLLVPLSTVEDATHTARSLEAYLREASSMGITLVHVSQTSDEEGGKTGDGTESHPFDVFSETLGDLGPFETVEHEGDDVVDVILETADEVGATAIGFTPTSRRRWETVLERGHTNQLVDSATRPVVVFPHPDTEEAHGPAVPLATGDDVSSLTVLVSIDGTGSSIAPVEYAFDTYPAADIAVLSVTQPATGDVYDTMTGDQTNEISSSERVHAAAKDERFEEIQRLADTTGVSYRPLALSGNRTKVLVDSVDALEADVLIMAPEADTGIADRLFGTGMASVVRQMPVPVILVQ